VGDSCIPAACTHDDQVALQFAPRGEDRVAGPSAHRMGPRRIHGPELCDAGDSPDIEGLTFPALGIADFARALAQQRGKARHLQADNPGSAVVNKSIAASTGATAQCNADVNRAMSNRDDLESLANPITSQLI